MRTVTDGDEIVKYADDAYLIIPEVNYVSCGEDELKTLTSGRFTGTYCCNHKQTVEILVHTRGSER